jgi:tetratricopeptide (TPR) repeat protein
MDDYLRPLEQVSTPGARSAISQRNPTPEPGQWPTLRWHQSSWHSAGHHLGLFLAVLILLSLSTSPVVWAAPPNKGKAHNHALAAAIDAWDLAKAVSLSKRAVGKKWRDSHTLLKARLAYRQSDYTKASNLLAKLLIRVPGYYEARVLLGRALLHQGDKTRAVAVLDVMAEDYNNDRITRPEDFMWLAVGLQLTGYPKDASETFQKVVKDLPSSIQARLLWARLFTGKFNFRDSDALYQEVLKRQPNHTDALLGRALIDLESDHNAGAARKKIQMVLTRFPHHIPAHNLLARLDLEQERPQDAIKRLKEKVLVHAPQNPRALTLLAASYLVSDDSKRFKAVSQQAMKLNPQFASFYSGVSTYAVR